MCKNQVFNCLDNDYVIYFPENAHQILDMIDAKYRDGNAIETAIKAGGYDHIEVHGNKSFVIVYSDPSEVGSALVYMRVSSDTQGKNGYGLDRQYDKIMSHIEEYNEKIAKFAHLEGYEDEYADKFTLHVAAIAFDVGISGDNRKDMLKLGLNVPLNEYFKDIRPGLHYVLSHLNKANRVVVEDVDRLWREFVFTASTVQKIIIHAESDVVVQKDWNYTLWETDPMRYFMNMMASCLADFDKKNTVNKLAASKVQAVLRGRDMSGAPHYGYEKLPDGTLRVKPEEAEIIRTEIIARLERGEKIRHIKESLNSKNILNVYGKAWCEKDIYQVFKFSRLIYGYNDWGDVFAYIEDLKIVEATDFLKKQNIRFRKNDECCA